MVQYADMNTPDNTTATTTTGTTTTAWPPLEPCASRLPCGLCLITQNMCPKYVEPMTIRWNEVTCK